ncbi:MAG: aldo/keto reductase, partial [Planctomycetia bacterium]
LPALRQVVDQGKARQLGVSGLPLKVFETLLERTTLDVVLSYCHYTLYDRTLLGLLPKTAAAGVGVVGASPLGMGLLTDDGPPEWHPGSAVLKDAARRAAALCRAHGDSLSELALRFALQQEKVASTLVGMTSVAEVDRNVAAVGLAPDPALLADVQALFAEVAEISWPSGRPENN